MEKRLFTSESVTEGHPDKICDQISDAVLDAYLEKDPKARVACEVLVNTGLVVIAGEINSTASVDVKKVAKEAIRKIGYTNSDYGLDYQTCAIMVAVDEQSPEINAGVEQSMETREDGAKEEIGAGDQGLMFGYASKETDTLMPLPIYLAHKLAKGLADHRKNESIEWLRPDAKTQVTVEYDEDNKPVRVDTVLISTQHEPDVRLNHIRAVIKHFIEQTIPEKWLDDETKFITNPSGSFVVGGPQGDAGLTGRKIVVDTYGGFARHGGGAFSGKDASKVDRSAAYASRYVAKNIVSADLAEECEVQFAYAIGVAEPVSISVNTFGTGKVSEEVLVKAVREVFNLKPAGIIEMLDLEKPVFSQTSAYGHFGRDDVEFTWERTDKAEELKQVVIG